MRAAKKAQKMIARELQILHRHGLLDVTPYAKAGVAAWDLLSQKDIYGKWIVSSPVIDQQWLEMQVSREIYKKMRSQNPLLIYFVESDRDPTITPNPLVDSNFINRILPSSSTDKNQTALYRYLNTTQDFHHRNGPSHWFIPQIYIRHTEEARDCLCPFAHFIRYGLASNNPSTYLFDPHLWKSRRIGHIEGPLVYDYLINKLYFSELLACRPAVAGTIDLASRIGVISGTARIPSDDREAEVYMLINGRYSGRALVEYQGISVTDECRVADIVFTYYLHPDLWKAIRNFSKCISLSLVTSEGVSIRCNGNKEEYRLTKQDMERLDGWQMESDQDKRGGWFDEEETRNYSQKADRISQIRQRLKERQNNLSRLLVSRMNAK